MKFEDIEVGQKLRVIKNNKSFHCFKLGEIVTVVGIDRDYGSFSAESSNGTWWGVYPEDVEPIEEDMNTVIPGLGPGTEIATNEKGGKQSKSPYGFHLMDARAMFKLAEVLAYGASKYERDNWRKITTGDHLNHALQHIFGYMAGDTQDDHLGHAFCRLMMAIGVDTKEQ